MAGPRAAPPPAPPHPSSTDALSSSPPPPPVSAPSAPRLLVYPVFLLSGICALVYQVVWTRMLTLVFGVSVYAVTTVLTSFMAGLALGSLYFGRRADRTARPLAWYGAVEIAIGLLAAASPFAIRALEPVFVHIYRNFYGNYYLFSLIRFAAVFAVLLPPTFLMGGTFPLVARQFIRDRNGLGRELGLLYAVNTGGAVLGALLVGFVMLAKLGMFASILTAAAANLAAGIAAIVLSRRTGPLPESGESSAESASPAAAPAADSDWETTRGGVRAAVLAAALSGFASLGLEVVWTRVLVFHTQNSTYAFSAMLAVFLAGLAGGGWIYGMIAHRIRRPFLWFAAIERGIGLLTISGVLTLSKLPALARFLTERLPNHWAGIMIVIVAQAAAVLLPPALLMGMALPLATRLAASGASGVGRRIGEVFAANTLGTVLGSFTTGFALIPLLGARNTFLVLAGVYFAAAGLLDWLERRPLLGKRWAGAAASLTLAAGAFLALPPDVVSREYARALGKVIFHKEEVTDTIMVIDLKGDPAYRTLVFGDGRGTAGHWSALGNYYFAHLPMFLHDNPKDVLNICVGAGNTIGAFTLHKGMERLDCVELSRGIAEAVVKFDTNFGVFREPRDPRLSLFIEDGRNYLLGTERQYDVIHLDPPELHTAGVVFLYTEEFYRLCRKALKPGGVLSHWINATQLTRDELRTLMAAFHKVFPNGTIWQGPDLLSWNVIGTAEPVRIPIKAMFDRFKSDPELYEIMKKDNLHDPLRFFSMLLMKPETVGAFAGDAPSAVDDRTIIDFSAPRHAYSGFGFYGIFSTTGKIQASMGGWRQLAEMTLKTDFAGDLFDWTGVSPEERAEMEKAIRVCVDERNGHLKSFLAEPAE